MRVVMYTYAGLAGDAINIGLVMYVYRKTAV